MRTTLNILGTLFLLMFFFTVNAAAQQNVTGTVVDDSNGEPLIGANIVIKGTAIGTATDLDGTIHATGAVVSCYAGCKFHWLRV